MGWVPTGSDQTCNGSAQVLLTSTGNPTQGRDMGQTRPDGPAHALLDSSTFDPVVKWATGLET